MALAINSLNDLYSAVKEMIEQLRSAGERELGQALEKAMFGATSGEILNDLGNQFWLMRGNESVHRLGLDETLAEALRYVNSTLRHHSS